MNKNKKAQLQSTETIFVVFFILIIVVIGFVVYSKYQEEGIKGSQRERMSMEAIRLAHRMSSWPELECSQSKAVKYACLDKTKLRIMADFVNNSMQQDSYAFNYYFSLLGDARVMVTEIYPSYSLTGGKDRWLIYENPGRTAATELIPVPVNLYDPFTRTYSLGVMELQIYD